MALRKILYTRPDGGVTVIHPTRNTLGEVPGITDAEIEQRAFAKLPMAATNPQFVDLAVIPSDRTFRDAWEHGGNTVVHNMAKARTIAQDRVREARGPRFTALDADYIRALEDNDTSKQAQIKAQKAILRNAPADPRIANAADPVALKAAVAAVIAELP
jgi:hypothetical protein